MGCLGMEAKKKPRMQLCVHKQTSQSRQRAQAGGKELMVLSQRCQAEFRALQVGSWHTYKRAPYSAAPLCFKSMRSTVCI